MPISPTPLRNRPVVRDRLNALAVFTGIAIGAVAGVEMVIGGGFDMLTPPAAFEAEAPRAWYDRPIQPGQGWLTQSYSIDGAVTQISLDLTESHPQEADAAPVELEGGPADASAPLSAPETSLRTLDIEQSDAAAPAQAEPEDALAAAEAMMNEALPETFKPASGTASPL